MKSRAPQLHLEYRFYKQLGSGGKKQCDTFYCNVMQDQSLNNFWFWDINLFNKLSLVTKAGKSPVSQWSNV